MNKATPYPVLVLVCWMILEPVTYAEHPANDYINNGYGDNLYGSKTAYFWMHPETTTRPVNSLLQTRFEGKTCSATHVNVVSRHGARYVSLGDMQAFTTLQNRLKAELGDQSYTIINTWRNTYPEDKADLLTYLGYKEMDYLGNKYGTQLRDLFTGTSNQTSLLDGALRFGATSRTRTQESARGFLNALLQSVTGKNDSMVPISIRDNVLRFYDNCKNYEEATASIPEQIKFQNGPEMQQVRDEITNKLQLNSTISVADTKMLWRLCATELAIMGDAEWCKLMTDEQREVVEYENDIEDFYGRLYGHPVTGQMACPLVEDIFTELDSAIAGHDSGASYTRGMFQFGHSDTVIDLAASLGFFNDSVPFMADNFQQLKTRKFNNAKVDPFSTHFAFILYNCGGQGSQNYALRVLFNGEPLPFPVCKSDICSYDTVRQSYGTLIDHCEWADVCNADSSVAIGK